MKTYRSFSSEKTMALGEAVANRLPLIAHRKTALVIALQGELGAGKTTFTQGFFKGLGIRRRPISPTFVIMRRYRIPRGKKSIAAHPSPFATVCHLDAYRLKKAEDLEVLEFGNMLSDPKNIILVEWPERVKEIFSKGTIWIKFTHGKKENERKITVGER